MCVCTEALLVETQNLAVDMLALEAGTQPPLGAEVALAVDMLHNAAEPLELLGNVQARADLLSDLLSALSLYP